MENVQIMLENNKGLILRCALLPSCAHTRNCKVFVDHYCSNMRFYSILSQVFSKNNPSVYISQLDFHLCGTICGNESKGMLKGPSWKPNNRFLTYQFAINQIVKVINVFLLILALAKLNKCSPDFSSSMRLIEYMSIIPAVLRPVVRIKGRWSRRDHWLGLSQSAAGKTFPCRVGSARSPPRHPTHAAWELKSA